MTERSSITGVLGSVRSITLFPIDDVRAGNIERSLPRWRAVLSHSDLRGALDLTGRVNYFGKPKNLMDPITSHFGLTPGVPTTAEAQALYSNLWPKPLKAQFSFDFEVGLTFAEKYCVAVGAENMFDAYPERETRNVFPTTGGMANGVIYPDAPLSQ